MDAEKTLSTLSPRQRAFVAAYLANGYNATRAAVDAGYSPASAYSQGHDLLKKPEIARAITAAITAHLAPRRLAAGDVLDRLCEAAAPDLAAIMSPGPDGGWTFDIARAHAAGLSHLLRIREHRDATGVVNQIIELTDPMQALSLLFKAHGLGTGRAEVVPPSVPTLSAVPDRDLDALVMALCVVAVPDGVQRLLEAPGDGS